MAARKPLRAVVKGELPLRLMSILEATERGTRLDELVAMRRRIAQAMDDPGCKSADLAALSRRQLEIGREVEAIVRVDEGDDIGAAAATPDAVWDASVI